MTSSFPSAIDPKFRHFAGEKKPLKLTISSLAFPTCQPVFALPFGPNVLVNYAIEILL